jgi:hypothetical protein
MTGPLRRGLARLLRRRALGSAPAGSSAPPRATEVSIGTKLDQTRVAYDETLDATKHQDDKIGRFMAGIAFLIAGALVFTNPTVLQATYLLGDTSLPLPALALGTFLVLVVLSLFFYVLAMSAPLTIPPGTTTDRRSHQYFLLIAGETRETWRAYWDRPATADEFARELAAEEVDEIRNLAIRADLKYERANEGSALFVLALLFFLLGIVLSIHVIQRLEIPVDGSGTTRAPKDLGWSLPLRALVGSLLALFPFALLYQRLRAEQRKSFDVLVARAKEGRRRLHPLHVLVVAYPVFVLLTVLPDLGRTHTNELMSAGIGLATLAAVLAFGRVLLPRDRQGAGPPPAGRRATAWLVAVLALGTGVLAVLAVLEDRPVWQLGIALVAAISPLAANLFAATILLNQRVRRQVR